MEIDLHVKSCSTRYLNLPEKQKALQDICVAIQHCLESVGKGSEANVSHACTYFFDTLGDKLFLDESFTKTVREITTSFSETFIRPNNLTDKLMPSKKAIGHAASLFVPLFDTDIDPESFEHTAQYLDDGSIYPIRTGDKSRVVQFSATSHKFPFTTLKFPYPLDVNQEADITM